MITETAPSVEQRVAVAKEIVLKQAALLDQKNVLGIMGFGSFWLPVPGRQPKDIDLVVYSQNDAEFDDEKVVLTAPLTTAFGLPVEVHNLTIYSSMVNRQVSDYQNYLVGGIRLWGKMPEWLN